MSDAIAGSIWKCANTAEVYNRREIMEAVMGHTDIPGQTFTPQQLKAIELQDFERLKQKFSTGIFKGL